MHRGKLRRRHRGRRTHAEARWGWQGFVLPPVLFRMLRRGGLPTIAADLAREREAPWAAEFRHVQGRVVRLARLHLCRGMGIHPGPKTTANRTNRARFR